MSDDSSWSGLFTDYLHHSDYSAGLTIEEALDMVASLDKQSGDRAKPEKRAEHAWLVQCRVCNLAGVVRAGSTHYCRGEDGNQDIPHKRVAGQYHVVTL